MSASMPAGPQIVAVGVACLDHAVAVESLSAGERIQCIGYVQAGGGMAATAMVAAQRLGARCALASSAANDPAGRFIREQLQDEGLDVKYFRLRRGGRTSTSLCLSEKATGRKLIIGLCGGARRLTPRDVDRGFWQMVEQARVLHLDGTHPQLALAAARRARTAGVTVHLDATSIGPSCDEFLGVADVVFASQTFVQSRLRAEPAPDILDLLAKITPARWVGLTLGGAGSVALDRATGERFFQPAYEVDVIDTVGAGDAYHGTISFALSRGWPLKRAMQLAAAVGALCCCGLSGRGTLPTLDQAKQFLQKARPVAQ